MKIEFVPVFCLMLFTDVIGSPFFLNKLILDDSFLFSWVNHGFHKKKDADGLRKKKGRSLLKMFKFSALLSPLPPPPPPPPPTPLPKMDIVGQSSFRKNGWSREDWLKITMVRKSKTVKKAKIDLTSILYQTEMRSFL